MNNTKYVIIIVHEIECAILFPPFIDHCDIADIYPKSNIISAGFCSVYYENNTPCVHVYGKSISLNIASRGKQDSDIIFRTLYPNFAY